MQNPFIYGEVVTSSNFADREDELKELSRDLKDCEKIFLISPRRYGKTSLIINVLKRLKKTSIYTIYLDLYKATSLHTLLELYSRELALAVESKVERAVNFIKEVLPGLRPKITIGANGQPSIGIEYVGGKKDILRFLDEIYDLPQKLAKKKGKKFVVVFDEFQEIRNFEGDSIEKAMRASFQYHRDVAYLFAGSKKHIFNDMIYNKNRAFYNMGRIINLGKIPRVKFAAFLEDKFKKSGFIVEEKTVNKVLETVEDYPYNAQFLCHQLWDMNFEKKKVEIKDIEAALAKILSEQTPFYLSLWDNLTLHQRNILRAIANFGGEKIFSQEFITETDIGPVSSLQTSIVLLIKKEIIEKTNGSYEISDVFFKGWVKKETG